MKKTKAFLFTLVLLTPYIIFSQESVPSSIIDALQKDALYREKVFIHTNKTIYFSQENIWFTAYVAKDHDNTPSEFTSNLYVNLLNQKGDILESKTIFINNGVGIGDFLITNNYKSGKYHIQGFTNYMKNFGVDNVFTQEIEIVNLALKNEIKQSQQKENYDIQVFPESGYLLESVENTLGIKALINGKGFPFSGKIVDSENKEVSTFTGNSFGMGKTKLFYESNKTYSVVVNINNVIKKINLPKANATGVIFSLDNSAADKVKLTVKTNIQTLPTLINEKLVLLFYRNNFIAKAVALFFTNSPQTTQELVFDKSKMLNGVNIVTLFRKNEPIAERKFYIDKPTEQTAVLLEELQAKNDSIVFKIKTIDKNINPVSAQLSISVLPKEAKTFYEQQNIKSAFLLSPYTKGYIENPAYYFNNSNANSFKFLDLLLLNQGWSTYSLKEKINEINPKEKFQFENGFTLKGNLKKVPKGYGIGMLSKKNRLAGFSKFNQQNEFLFENIFAYKGDSLKIALIKKDKPLLKPTNISFLEAPLKKQYFKLISTQDTHSYKDKRETKTQSNSEKNEVIKYTYYPNTVQLDEVLLKPVRTKKKLAFYEKEMKLAQSHNVIGASFYKGIKVTKQLEVLHTTVFDYFYNLGYIRQGSKNGYFIRLRNMFVNVRGKDDVKYLNPDGSYAPKLYLNDLPTDGYDDISLLRELGMYDVDDILINKSGMAGGGGNTQGGIIYIYLRDKDHQYFDDETTNLYETLVLQTGFDKATNYYKPTYNNYSKQTFEWTEVSWENNLKTNEKGEAVIKIPTNEFSNEFQFIINGLSEKGLLFNTIYKTSEDDF